MGDFSWKIWFKKLGKGLGATILATGLIYVADYMQATEFPIEYAFWAGLAVVALTQIGNWIKHTFLV